MGVTVLAASGDNGSTDGSTSGNPTVDFPASSPFLVGCGGTKLTLSGTSISSEQTWNELSANEGATGGGVSQAFALPSFQQSANVPKAPNGFVGRGVPDVAGDADPATGYNVVVDGQQSVIGGTSAVAPLWAGLFALINRITGSKRRLREPASIFRESRSHLSRHHRRKQRHLLRRPWLGRLHRPRQPKRRRTPHRPARLLNWRLCPVAVGGLMRAVNVAHLFRGEAFILESLEFAPAISAQPPQSSGSRVRATPPAAAMIFELLYRNRRRQDA